MSELEEIKNKKPNNKHLRHKFSVVFDLEVISILKFPKLVVNEKL